HRGNPPSAHPTGAGRKPNAPPTPRSPGSEPRRCGRRASWGRPGSYAEPTGRVLQVPGSPLRTDRLAKIPTPDPRLAFRPAHPLVDLRVSSHLAVTVRRSIAGRHR